MTGIVDQFNNEFKHATKVKNYTVHLSSKEMQHLANAVAGFFNVMKRENVQISPPQIACLMNVMTKLKAANGSNDYKISEEF